MTDGAQVIIVWGDSIAASGWPERLEQSYNVAHNTGTPIRVINQGVGGMPAARARHMFDERIAAHQPDLVVIQFGFNDVRYDGSRGDKPLSTAEEFEQHMMDMAKRCALDARAKVLLLANHRPMRANRMPSGNTYQQDIERYNAVTQRVAQVLGLAFMDMTEATTAAGADWRQIVNEDGVHLSPLGLHMYAAMVAGEVGRLLSEA